jgi:type VI secretion system protein VasJ
VEKLDAPGGGTVDWKRVSEKAAELLQTKTKDLFLASVLAHALHVTAGLDGLVAGAALIAEMLDRYWETMQPERMRGRANTLRWYVDKTSIVVLARSASDGAERLDRARSAVQHLAEVARGRLAAAAPAFGPMLEAIDRRKLALPAPPKREAPPARAAPAKPPVPTSGTAAAAPAPAAAVSAAAAPSPPSPCTSDAVVPAPARAAPAGLFADPADPKGRVDFLLTVGSALVEAASKVRHADATLSTSYRMLRIGLWLYVSTLPIASRGRVELGPPPEPVRKKLLALAEGEKWAEFLEESELAVARNPLALDLQRCSWLALCGLGSAYEGARDSVAVEVRCLLARCPTLTTLAFSDGTPIAESATCAWIDEVTGPRSTQEGEPPPVEAKREPDEVPPDDQQGDSGESSVAVDGLVEASRLLKAGEVAAALGLMQKMVLGATCGRERFLVRLEMARACAGAELAALAKGIYEELDREAMAHRLDVWEPNLVVDGLKGLVTAARALTEDLRGSAPEWMEYHRRLCTLDPATAHELWPDGMSDGSV